jgi:Zn finger protein HypA/HybF involved in hydrogenase expression
MNNAQELKAHLQDRNKARIYAEKKNKHNVLIARMYEEKKKQMSSEKLKTKEELSPIVVCQNCDGQNIGTNTHTYEGFCEDCKSVNVEIKMLSEVDDE